MASRCTLVMFIYVHFFLASDELTTDPCPADIDKNIVATMCENSAATEHSFDGGISVDSVVLRVAEQKDNCVCSIGIMFQPSNESTFYMQKYDGLVQSVPTVPNCGLEIDVISPDTVQTFDSIRCIEGLHGRLVSTDRYKIYLTSRTTADPFINGYCLQFYRNSTQSTPATLTIDCFDSPVNNITTAYPIKDQLSTDFQSSTKQTTITKDLITEEMGITNKKASISTPSAGTNFYIGNKKDTVLLPVAIVGWIMVAILLFFIILDKSRRMVEKRKEERDNRRLNYEIPNCLRRESANYSDLDHIEI